MQPIRVNKASLIERVKANRDQHRDIFEKAADGYRRECLRLLDKHIETLKAGKLEAIWINLPIPQDHTSDYDAVLDMLDMEISDEITVTDHDFRKYVRDEWEWKGQFTTSTQQYISK